MTRAACCLETMGYVLRSGGADGADDAFEAGASEQAREIYLPWRGFNGRSSDLTGPTEEAMSLGDRFHPWLSVLDERSAQRGSKKVQTLRKLMGRNVHQVLGWQLNEPARFVLCWTPDGADGTRIPTTAATGGTGQAIRVAAAHRVPVYNLADERVLARVEAMVSSRGL